MSRSVLIRRPAVWTFRGPRGEGEQVAVAMRAQASTAEGLRALVVGGGGFGVLPEYLVADDVQRGALLRICPEWYWKDVLLFALLPSAGRAPQRVSMFLEALRASVEGGDSKRFARTMMLPSGPRDQGA